MEADRVTFEEAVSRINVALSHFDINIRKSLSQTSGDPLWAIVSPQILFFIWISDDGR
jgi:hypothetical protein